MVAEELFGSEIYGYGPGSNTGYRASVFLSFVRSSLPVRRSPK